MVQLKLKRYDARILSAYVPIVPKHIWGKVGFGKLTKFNPCCPMVGSGPFYVKSLDPQGTSVLLPNPYFYGPRGHIKRILLIRYQDEEAMLRDLKLGRVDAINSGAPAWVDSLGTHAKLWASPGPGFNELAFNMCPPQGSPICTGPAPGVAREGGAGPGHPPRRPVGDRPKDDRPGGLAQSGAARGRASSRRGTRRAATTRTGRRIQRWATTTTRPAPVRC